MKNFGILFASFITLLSISSTAAAGDFDWMKSFNIQAQADPSGLKARLEARFRVGEIKINAVLGCVDAPADAYMLLRLGEISNRPVERVVETYKAHKGKGWGALAKSLGIKPGSKAFHALKQGQDLYVDKHPGGKRLKSKGKGKKKN